MRLNNKLNFLAVALLSSFVGFTSCEEKEEKALTGAKLEFEKVIFNDNGGTREIKIITTGEWSAETTADWALISPASGNGTTICTISADSSYSYKEREALIRFYTATTTLQDTIRQFGYERVIKFENESYGIPHYKMPEEAFVDVNVTANVAYQVIIADEDKNWLSLEGDKNHYEPETTVPRAQTFRFKYSVHSDFTKKRIAKVVFKGIDPEHEVVDTLRIEQDKAPKIIPSRMGDSLTLVSLQRSLDSYYKWDLSRPITHWGDLLTEEVTYTYVDEELNISKDTTEIRVIGLTFFMFNTNGSIPYEVKYLTELQSLAMQGNENGYRKKIRLGDEITKVPKLRSLALSGYGISEICPEFANMSQLEELSLSGNTMTKVPVDVLCKMTNLKYLDLSGNRLQSIWNLSDIPAHINPEEIGLRGIIPTELFNMENLEYLALAYNHFEGAVPYMPVGSMPNLKQLYLNLNRLEGEIPQWILQHPRLACWDPYTLIFNQEGFTATGKAAGFTNVPARLPNPECPDWVEQDLAIALKLPPLTEREKETKPLRGYWRYYHLLK